MPNVKNVHMVKMNNFGVWVNVIPSHLRGRRNCARIAKIMYSKYCSADYATKTTSNEEAFYTKSVRLVEAIDFGIRIILI